VKMRTEDQYFLIIWGSIFGIGFLLRRVLPVLRKKLGFTMYGAGREGVGNYSKNLKWKPKGRLGLVSETERNGLVQAAASRATQTEQRSEQTLPSGMAAIMVRGNVCNKAAGYQNLHRNACHCQHGNPLCINVYLPEVHGPRTFVQP
jgi:hypothetical protein